MVSCQKDNPELLKVIPSTSIKVLDNEIGLQCSQTLIEDTLIIPAICKVVILKDTSFVLTVLREVTNYEWLKLLNIKSSARSTSLWLHMKTGKDGSHFYKLTSSEWYDRYWKKEVEYWTDYLNSNVL